MCGLNLVLLYKQIFNNEMLRRTTGLEMTEGEQILQRKAL